jgi:acetylornithine deacetylase/succinyl-diaminopimelate desuccinylase-like protein
MDFRLVADMRAADIERKLKKHLRTHGFGDIELVELSKEDPAKTPVESHIAQTLITAVEMVGKETPNVWPTIAGTGPMSLFTRDLKLPTAMGAGVNYPGASFHAPNEHIVIDYYMRGIKQLICLFAIF